MKKFSVLFADGACVTEKTNLTKNGIAWRPESLSDLVSIVVTRFKKLNHIKKLQDFCDEDFSIDMVRDQIHSNYTINIDGKHVDFHSELEKYN